MYRYIFWEVAAFGTDRYVAFFYATCVTIAKESPTWD